MVWRVPAEESVGLYPKLVVWDRRVAGAITIGQSRLPISSILFQAFHDSWEFTEEEWGLAQYDFSAEDLIEFLYRLLDVRGEFARLLLMLANAELKEAEDTDSLIPADIPWFRNKEIKTAIKEQLLRCVESLEREPTVE